MWSLWVGCAETCVVCSGVRRLFPKESITSGPHGWVMLHSLHALRRREPRRRHFRPVLL